VSAHVNNTRYNHLSILMDIQLFLLPSEDKQILVDAEGHSGAHGHGGHEVIQLEHERERLKQTECVHQ